jgi:uncharacterized membrane protein YadS
MSMSSVARNLGAAHGAAGGQAPAGRSWYQTEDSWAILLGVGLVVIAVAAVLAGSNINWIAVAPGAWNTSDEIGHQLLANAGRYAALFLFWLALFGISTPALGIRPAHFVPAFALLFAASLLVMSLGAWSAANRYNLEPPLVALALGLIVSNTVGLPRWLDAGFRVEYYIKVGIVLLGATLPLTLLLSAGPVAIAQAAVVSLVTFGVIYFVGVRLGLDRRFAATLGAGGAVCGVSAAIAVSGAVGAKKEHAPVAITIVIFWAIVMIFVLPVVSRALGLPTGVAGAWIGTSEFADAAGFAAAQAYGGYAGHVPGIPGSADAAVNAFTLMKVIGRDLWIGIWAFVLSIVAVTRWEATGVDTRTGAGQIWRRFPKFVIGFVIASALISLLAAAYGSADFNKVLKPEVVGPIKTLRTWAFTFCFLSIGLTTRWRELAGVGLRPFLAFSSGVVVNVLLGFVLSAVVFGGYWAALGTP